MWKIFMSRKTLMMLTLILPLALYAGPEDKDYQLGRTISKNEIEALGWYSIGPQGQNLPQGNGDYETGKRIYMNKCAFCHGGYFPDNPKASLVAEKLHIPVPVEGDEVGPAQLVTPDRLYTCRSSADPGAVSQ